MNIENRRLALVTGSNRGIGFAIAQGLLLQGYEVIITSRSLDKAKQAQQQLQALGVVIPIELDVSDDRTIDAAVATLRNQGVDRIDVLINNAAIQPDRSADILTISRELLDAVLNTNLSGAIRVAQAFLPFLENSSDARVINIASSMATLANLTMIPVTPGYNLSKLALNGATIILAESLRLRGIAVNSMCPGWVKTDLGGELAPLSPEQGADTAIWLATEVPHNESGKFWRDRKVVSF